jgi:hypothetical protein
LTPRRAVLAASLLLASVTCAAVATAEAVHVELQRAGQGWQLLRGGEPYFIRGAGGNASLQALAAAGANSVRTWGGEVEVGSLLDDAQALGMTVTVGIWLGHERHGFDYSDEAQVAAQLEQARQVVLRYRDHPALLIWGIGNEMEGFAEGDDPAVWAAVDRVAAMVKELDPHHPTMTVTAFMHGKRIEFVHRHSPAIDIHGINAYAAAGQVPALLRAGGATKPFVLTEFGPPGPWRALRADQRREGPCLPAGLSGGGPRCAGSGAGLVRLPLGPQDGGHRDLARHVPGGRLAHGRGRGDDGALVRPAGP